MIVEVPQIQTVRVGSEVKVKCEIGGRGYDVTWSLGGVAIASTNGINHSEYVVRSDIRTFWTEVVLLLIL